MVKNAGKYQEWMIQSSSKSHLMMGCGLERKIPFVLYSPVDTKLTKLHWNQMEHLSEG
jgi:hypothetical protein